MTPAPEMSEAMTMLVAGAFGIAAILHVGLAVVWDELAAKVLHCAMAVVMTAAALVFVFES